MEELHFEIKIVNHSCVCRTAITSHLNGGGMADREQEPLEALWHLPAVKIQFSSMGTHQTLPDTLPVSLQTLHK